MNAVLIPMASANNLKRTCEVAQLDALSLQQQPYELLRDEGMVTGSADVSSSQPDVPTTTPTPERSRAPSAAPSAECTSTRDGSVPPATCTTPNPGNQSKRRKLTFAEKEVQRLEKQFKEQQRAEEKARKDEEKRIREEERRVKEETLKEEKRRREEEKEEKKKAKEAEKQARDEERKKREVEKKAKEDEKAKKEKASNPKNGSQSLC